MMFRPSLSGNLSLRWARRVNHYLVLSFPRGDGGFAFLAASGLCSSPGFWSSGLRNWLGGGCGRVSCDACLFVAVCSNCGGHDEAFGLAGLNKSSFLCRTFRSFRNREYSFGGLVRLDRVLLLNVFD